MFLKSMLQLHKNQQLKLNHCRKIVPIEPVYITISCMTWFPTHTTWYLALHVLPLLRKCTFTCTCRHCSLYMYLYCSWVVPLWYICIRFPTIKHIHVWSLLLQAIVCICTSKLSFNVTRRILLRAHVHVLVRADFFWFPCTYTCTAHIRTVLVYLHQYYPNQARCTCFDRVMACKLVLYYQ